MSKAYVGLVPGQEYYHCDICERYHYKNSQIGEAHFEKGIVVRVRGHGIISDKT